MFLPKYEAFSTIGLINIALGVYIFKWLVSLGIEELVAFILLTIYNLIFIILYENLRIELKINYNKENVDDK